MPRYFHRPGRYISAIADAARPHNVEERHGRYIITSRLIPSRNFFTPPRPEPHFSLSPLIPARRNGIFHHVEHSERLRYFTTPPTITAGLFSARTSIHFRSAPCWPLARLVTAPAHARARQQCRHGFTPSHFCRPVTPAARELGDSAVGIARRQRAASAGQASLLAATTA